MDNMKKTNVQPAPPFSTKGPAANHKTKKKVASLENQDKFLPSSDACAKQTSSSGRRNVKKHMEMSQSEALDIIREYQISTTNIDKELGPHYFLTHLSKAAKGGDIKLMQALIFSGASVNKIIDKCDTALITACSSKKLEAVKCLVQNGAIVDFSPHSEPDNSNSVPLYMFTPLKAAADEGASDIVEYLLKNGADTELNTAPEKSKLSMTALAEVCISSEPSLDVVKVLVDNHANVNAQNNFYRMTPLMAACRSGNFEVAEFLLERDADSSLLSTNEENALFYLVAGIVYNDNDPGYVKSLDLFNKLIRKGADPLMQANKEGDCVLVFADKKSKEFALSKNHKAAKIMKEFTEAIKKIIVFCSNDLEGNLDDHMQSTLV